ncbi:CidA/LrgA family protein [Diplocloster agilis]|mgnify:CR=1 FL=1|uniref:CidA/LrgA family protein n=1 Tax=Diplocloster agilis TaxID=2850323 RepID=A0A949K8V7_9FIRM|nr:MULTISPECIES: CidA/LrgA family protein [Lachnospiraceae]MBU9738772.1 CidA/LrgA family protein [Diplocloster agilis]MBU9746487.1 CidA/LrgA family protein [Diplocloster agilis]MCU6736214.1 CidA/LrgA family protein [Suonthocola fibrivorans]SCJ87940.1 Antiholin-like protein LrgA [uncultured Clostridium sp.]
MNILKQCFYLLLICFIGEAVALLLPVPLPASIISMVLLFLLLLTGWFRETQIREVSDFLLGNMAVLFIPAGVSIINYFDEIRSVWPALLAIILISTIVTFLVTAFTTQLMIRFMARRGRSYAAPEAGVSEPAGSKREEM